METSTLKDMNLEKIKLEVPELQDISHALSNGLAKNFAHVDVNVVECPDLTKPPYSLACKGLGGNPAVVQVGDPGNFVLLNFKEYDFRDVLKALNLDSSYLFGAGGGAGCVPYVDSFSELRADVKVEKDVVQNFSKDVFTKNKTLSGVSIEPVDVNETRFTAVGNLFASQGVSGKVIRISCGRRIGNDDFPTSIINSLNSVFAHPIALGAVFCLKRGKVKTHIAPEKRSTPVKSTAELMKWVLLLNVSPPYVAVGTILTRNPDGWGVQLSHFHGCNETEGGHYHFDVTPDEVEYEAFVAPAETLCTIDKADKPISLFDYEV